MARLTYEQIMELRQKEKEKVPFETITDNYQAVKKDILKKVSPITLKYLRLKGVVKSPFYSIYKIIPEEKEIRKMYVDNTVIEKVNRDFIAYYEKL